MKHTSVLGHAIFLPISYVNNLEYSTHTVAAYKTLDDCSPHLFISPHPHPQCVPNEPILVALGGQALQKHRHLTQGVDRG